MFKKLTYFILIIGLAPIFFTSGCSVIEGFVGGLARVCSLTTYTVTKTEDTFDGICTSDDCSLREAISTANDCPGHHTIELPAGTYVIAITGRDEDGNLTGDFDITDDLTINGSGNPIIGASGHDRVFHTFSDGGRTFTVEINGLNITGGNAQMGGGLLNETNTTLNNVHIYENSATVLSGGIGTSAGGGIHNTFRTLTLNNVEIFNNVADVGGGIHNFATASLITNNLFIHDNRANNSGGALWNNYASTSRHSGLMMMNNSATENGGGIYNGGGNITITNSSIISGNDAGAAGGGIYNLDADDRIPASYGDLTTEQTVFRGNTAAQGAGLFNAESGVVDLLSTDFFENLASIQGGAIFNSGTANLRAVQIRDNRARDGGGIFNSLAGGLIAAAATFESNSAIERGGALLNEGDANVHHSLFTNNISGGGSAAILNNATGTLELSNVTLSHNIADSATESEFRYSVLTNLGTASLNFVTVTDNIIPLPGGAVLSLTGSIDINNSIIANNTSGDCNIASTSSFSTENLDSDGSCTGFSITADPLLAPLGDNGGTTFTHALLPDSPAIDAATGICVRDDQRSVSRPQGAACDLGAFELAGTPAPTPEAADTPSANKDSICYWGPGDEYGTVNSIPKDTEVKLLGKGQTAGWIIVDTPINPGIACWAPVGDFDLAPDLDLSKLPEYPVPPLPETQPDEGGDTETKPAAPSNLVPNHFCNVNGGKVELSWTDNADNEIGFRIYRDGNLIATVSANTISYVDENLAPGQYSYSVEAFNSAGVSSQTTKAINCP